LKRVMGQESKKQSVAGAVESTGAGGGRGGGEGSVSRKL